MAKKVIQKVTQKDALIEVSTTVVGSKKDKAERIKIRPFVTETATVGVKYGATIPTGDYKSVRVDVFISSPCYKEEMLDVFNQCSSLADELMNREVERLTEKK